MSSLTNVEGGREGGEGVEGGKRGCGGREERVWREGGEGVEGGEER